MKRALAILACLAMALPAQAFAQSNDDDQTPLNSRIKRGRQYPLQPKTTWQPDQLSKANKQRSKAMMGQFGKCVYRRNKTQALDLLAKTDLGFVSFEQVGLESDKASRLFGFKDCLSRVAESYNSGVVLSWSAPALRRWLVEQAYFDIAPDGPDWAKPGYVVDERKYPLSENYPSIHAALDIADCVVASDPHSADYLFRTEAGSAEEKEALSKIIPVLAPCIPQGQQVQLDPAQFRIWIGEALWHAANNSYPAPADNAGSDGETQQ